MSIIDMSPLFPTGVENSSGGGTVTGRKRPLSEILDIDQYSTRVNLNLDNSGQGLGWMRDEVFNDEFVIETKPMSADASSFSRLNGWMTPRMTSTPIPTPAPSSNNRSPIQMLPNNGFMSSPPARTKVYNPVHKKYEYECVFCKGNNEPDYVYKTHPIRINETVICPALRKHVCQICGATGDNAHTIKYCPHNTRGFYAGYRPQVGQQGAAAAGNDVTPPRKTQQQNGLLPPPLFSIGVAPAFGNRSGSMFDGTEAPVGPISGKKYVRKLNFDEPLPAAKSTAGFFKNLHQLSLGNGGEKTAPPANGFRF